MAAVMLPDGTQAAVPADVAVIRRRALDPAWRAAVADAWRALWVSRLLLWVTAVDAVAIWGISRRAVDFDPLGLTRPFTSLGDLLVAPAARWDSVWFLRIAEHGYVADEPARAAFFPLYPLLVRIGEALTGSAIVGGILVSSLAFAVALVVLHRLTALELGSAAARATVWLTALFPVAFFFSAVYSESLFLALSVGAVYAARTGRWGCAGALGALGAATRSAGVLLVVPLAVLYLREHRRPHADALWIAVVPLGVAAFCAWLALRGGDASAPLHAQGEWYRHFTGPLAGARDATVAAWDGARQLLSGSRAPVYFERAGGDPFAVAGHNLTLFAFLAAAIPAVVGVLRRLPAAYGAYVVTALMLPLSFPAAPQPLMSLPRFLAVLFPLFMWFGWWASQGQWRQRAVMGVSAAGLVVFTAQFATWHWVA
jgi:mannosyltransferase PIG-V